MTLEEDFLVELQKRRENLRSLLPKNTVVILVGNNDLVRSNDITYPFFQERNLYYFTGYNQADAIALIDDKCYGLLTLPKDPLKEMWYGKRFSQQEVKDYYLTDFTGNVEKWKEVLKEKIVNKKVYLNISLQNKYFVEIKNFIKSHALSLEEKEIKNFISNLRIKKSSYELKCIRYACEIAAQAHNDILGFCLEKKDSISQDQIENIYNYKCRLYGGDLHIAYPHIIASGDDNLCLHYIQNNKKILDKQLVLIDAGASYQHYNADITRTFPINGKFSQEQKDIYLTVYETMEAVIKEVKIQITLAKLHEFSIKKMLEILISKKIIPFQFIDELLKNGAYKEFYPHSVGHFLGLDVHDLGDKNQALENGMVFTIEPGIYITPNIKIFEKKYWGIGVRLEQTVGLVQGNIEVFTKNAKFFHEKN